MTLPLLLLLLLVVVLFMLPMGIQGELPSLTSVAPAAAAAAAAAGSEDDTASADGTTGVSMTPIRRQGGEGT